MGFCWQYKFVPYSQHERGAPARSESPSPPNSDVTQGEFSGFLLVSQEAGTSPFNNLSADALAGMPRADTPHGSAPLQDPHCQRCGWVAFSNQRFLPSCIPRSRLSQDPPPVSSQQTGLPAPYCLITSKQIVPKHLCFSPLLALPLKDNNTVYLIMATSKTCWNYCIWVLGQMQPWQTCTEINAVVLKVHLLFFLRCCASIHCIISFGTWKVK